jgi:hypothetical protein
MPIFLIASSVFHIVFHDREKDSNPGEKSMHRDVEYRLQDCDHNLSPCQSLLSATSAYRV